MVNIGSDKIFLKLCIVMVIIMFSVSAKSETWEQKQSQVCGRECRNGKIFRNAFCSDANCFPCDCEETCAMLGTCCPTYDQATDSYSYPYGASPQTDPSVWYGLLDCRKPSYERSSYLTVVRCPQSWSDEDIRVKCEQATHDSMESVTPFSDEKTGLVFKNAYCALCNDYRPQAQENLENKEEVDGTEEEPGEEDEEMAKRDTEAGEVKRVKDQSHTVEEVKTVRPWRLKIQCRHYQNLYQVANKFEFLKEVESLTGQCQARFEAPLDRPWRPRRCKDFNLITSSHNGTCGASEEVELACKQLPPLPGLAILGYMNWFCALCAGISPVIQRCILTSPTHPPDSIVIEDYLPPMYLLFSLGFPLDKNDNDETLECPPGYWKINEKDNCTIASCSPGKHLDVQTMTCATTIDRIGGLGYNLAVVLRPLGKVYVSNVTALHGAILSQRFHIFSGTEHDLLFSVVTCTGKEDFDEGNPLIDAMKFSGFIFAPETVPRDEFEASLGSSILESDWDLEIVYHNKNLKKNFSLEVLSIGLSMNKLYELHDMQGSSGSANGCLTQTINVDEKFEITPHISDTLKHKDLFIDINPSLVCPFVEFANNAQSAVNENGTLYFTVEIRGKKRNVTKGFSFIDGTLFICLGEFYSITQIMPTKENSTLLVEAIYYLEILCSCLSIACLGLSFMTYSLFQSLRSVPGLNNMCLCFSLATAQTSLVVSTVFGFKGHLSKTHCLVNGIIAHYSWLATFCWLNTCCIHMFLVFTQTRPNAVLRDHKRHGLYCLQSFGIPIIIVVSTLGISAVVTNGQSVGYSDKICFLEVRLSYLIPMLSLTVPFGIAMMINCVLFTLTIKEIIQVSRLQQTVKSSHGVMTYVKLSSVTGLFFLLEAVAVLTEEPILMLVATPFMALQGLFIFLSFTANRNVLNLFRELIARKTEDNTSTGTSHRRAVFAISASNTKTNHT